MATVRYKVMKKAEKNPQHKGQVIIKDVEDKILDRTQIKRTLTETDEVSIAEAQIIVSGGKGLGNSEGFKLLKELADALGGAVGASRLVVDEGWIPYKHQVGLSGKTVRPKLYIACGISGAVQHLAGMQTSDVIVAINKDPSAPIFRIADYSIIGDLNEVVPEIIKLVKMKYREAEK
jgi:electron transfer flavoprotein alpha subunit